MLGRMIRIAVLAGVGTLAYRWWQNKQAEDREYATGGGTESSAGSARAGGGSRPAGAAGSAGGTTSPMGVPVNQVPAQ